MGNYFQHPNQDDTKAKMTTLAVQQLPQEKLLHVSITVLSLCRNHLEITTNQ